AFPKDADICKPGFGDAAGNVYLGFKRGLKWYTLKYVWSTIGHKGQVCEQHSNPFSAQTTTVLEVEGPTHEWRTEEIDLRASFRLHFADGDPNADVPDFVGIGLLSDGDQTQSMSGADYAEFT